jgi:hypothetical protein
MGILHDQTPAVMPVSTHSARLAAAGPSTAPASAGSASELARRRDTLAAQVAELHWDLGGLAYEMAIRDHFRLDVLVRRAAHLQERDAELAEVERLLRMEESGAAGSCSACAAPHSRGAVFCWQCGQTLMERLPSDAAGGTDTTAAMMDALLDGHGLADGRGLTGLETPSDRGE